MNETTIFKEAFGDSPVIKVLDFLLEGRNLDYSMTDIAENANIGWTTLHRIWANLINFELVKHTRDIGKAKLFKLNQENPVVKELIKIYDMLLIQQTEKTLSQKLSKKLIAH